MHPAAAFHETDEARLAALVAETGLGVVIGQSGAGLRVAHAPVLLEGRRLRFHLSRTNLLAATLEEGGRALVVVTGDHAYISPDWYGAPDQVPTWNYICAEIEGPLRTLDEDELIVLLDDLSATFEARLQPKPPWTRAKMAPGRFEALAKAIVGFEMTVERLEGVTKLSQNKPEAVRAAVARALAEQPDPLSRGVARAMSAKP
jgi:transcriptional regulator